MKRVAVALLLVSRVAAADAPDAERLYNEGQTAYDDQRFDDAITAWTKAYALSHLPALVYNLAQAQRLGGHCEKAVAAYEQFVKLDPASPQRADADSRLKELSPCPSATAPVPLPQPHQPPPPPPPVANTAGRGAHIAGLVLIGLGVVVAAGGPYFGSQAQSDASDVKAACATHCEWTADLADKDSQGRRDATLQYAAYGAGAAALIAGALIYHAGSRAHRNAEAPQVTIVPRPGGAALAWTGSW